MPPIVTYDRETPSVYKTHLNIYLAVCAGTEFPVSSSGSDLFAVYGPNWWCRRHNSSSLVYSVIRTMARRKKANTINKHTYSSIRKIVGKEYCLSSHANNAELQEEIGREFVCTKNHKYRAKKKEEKLGELRQLEVSTESAMEEIDCMGRFFSGGTLPPGANTADFVDPDGLLVVDEHSKVSTCGR